MEIKVQDLATPIGIPIEPLQEESTSPENFTPHDLIALNSTKSLTELMAGGSLFRVFNSDKMSAKQLGALLPGPTVLVDFTFTAPGNFEFLLTQMGGPLNLIFFPASAIGTYMGPDIYTLAFERTWKSQPVDVRSLWFCESRDELSSYEMVERLLAGCLVLDMPTLLISAAALD
jgi:hypothetical protein